MKVLLVFVCFLGAVQATTTAVSREQQCLEDFVSITQSWFGAVRGLALEQVDALLQVSAAWGQECGEIEMGTMQTSPKVQGLISCYRTIARLPGIIAQLTKDLTSQDTTQLVKDALEVVDVLESLVLDCGI